MSWSRTWRQPARLRDRIVPGYWSIDLDVVHATAQEQLPGFSADLRRVLATVATQDDEGPSLRHSYAQRHANAGVPVDVLRELMDHVSAATTMGYYQQQLVRLAIQLGRAQYHFDSDPELVRRAVRPQSVKAT